MCPGGSTLAQRTLNEVLKSTSDSLFPAGLGKAEVRIDSADCDGETPLHVLILRSDAEGALLLIENGANIDAIGDMGDRPLHVAISKNEKRVIDALLEAGARTDNFPSSVKRKQRRLVNMVCPCEKTHNNCIEFARCAVCRPFMQRVICQDKYERFL